VPGETSRDSIESLLKSKAPTWDVQLVPFKYDPAWQSDVFKGGGGGGAYINWLLAHDMYFGLNHFIDKYQYLMRLDDDVSARSLSPRDVFQDMHDNGIRVGWVQHIFDNAVAMASNLVDKAAGYVGQGTAVGSPVGKAPHTFPLSNVWPLMYSPKHLSLKNPTDNSRPSKWRPVLAAGCVEMYNLDVFRNQQYKDYLAAIGADTELKARHYWEQELKTIWMEMFVGIDQWKSYGCWMDLQHKDIPKEAWFFNKCDYKTGKPTARDRCVADPDPKKMRIC
jgi:hypothetical protein